MPTRTELIHKAASLPKGSPERRLLLRQLTAGIGRNPYMPRKILALYQEVLAQADKLDTLLHTLQNKAAREADRMEDEIAEAKRDFAAAGNHPDDFLDTKEGQEMAEVLDFLEGASDLGPVRVWVSRLVSDMKHALR